MGGGISHQLEAYVGQIKGFGRAGQVNRTVHVVDYQDLSSDFFMPNADGVEPLEFWEGSIKSLEDPSGKVALLIKAQPQKG